MEKTLDKNVTSEAEADSLDLCFCCGQTECVCDDYPDGFWRRNVQFHNRNLPVGSDGRRSAVRATRYEAKCPHCGKTNAEEETLSDWGWMSFNCYNCHDWYTASFDGSDEMGFRTSGNPIQVGILTDTTSGDGTTK